MLWTNIEWYLASSNFSSHPQQIRIVAEGRILVNYIDPLRKGLHIIDSVPTAGYNRRRFTLNGITRGAVGDIEAVPSDMETSHFYRVGKVLYHVRDKGFIAERRRIKAISCAVRVTLLKHRVKRAVPKLVEEYRGSMERYTSREFWDGLLKEQR